MLWFKFILGLKVFELVSILFAIVPDYGNEYMTKENKNWTSFKNFALNLSHNISFPREFDFAYKGMQDDFSMAFWEVLESEIGQEHNLPWLLHQ